MATFKPTDIALVTGGGSGIGRATCQLLAERGVTVVAADINKTAAEETVRSLSGKNHLAVAMNVTSMESVTSGINDVIAKYSSPPNIAVNSAGLFFYNDLLDTSEESFDAIYNINVKGTAWVTQAVCKALVAANKKGSIINVSSIAKTGLPQMTLYGGTKGAVESFTFSAAKEMGPHGIRVNVISPGNIDTPMTAPHQHRKIEYRGKNPLGRCGKPEEIGEVIAFLASEHSSYVNGTSMYVHGGFL